MQGFAVRLVGDVRQHLPGFIRIWAGPEHGSHGFADAAGTHGLQGASHLGDVLDTANPESYFSRISHSGDALIHDATTCRGSRPGLVEILNRFA